jgi:hypothetical protein
MSSGRGYRAINKLQKKSASPPLQDITPTKSINMIPEETRVLLLLQTSGSLT